MVSITHSHSKYWPQGTHGKMIEETESTVWSSKVFAVIN